MRTLRVLVGDHADLGAGVTVPGVFGREVVRWPGGGQVERLPDVDWVHVVGQSTGWLRRFTCGAAAAATAARVTVVVDSWRAPSAGWSGRVGALPGLVRHEVRLPTSATGRALVDLTVTHPLPVAAFLTAALAGLAPRLHLPRLASAEVVVDGPPLPWLDAPTGHLPPGAAATGEDFLRSYDVMLTRHQRPSRPPAGVAVLAASPAGAQSSGDPPVIMLDPLVANPVGLTRPPDDAGPLHLRVGQAGTGAAWWVRPPSGGDPLMQGGFDPVTIDDRHRELLRSATVVHYESTDPTAGADPAGEAALIAHLAATGVLLHADRLPAPVAALLSPELGREIQRPPPDLLSDPVEREIRSVRQRLAALRGHATTFRLAGAARLPRGLPRLPTVSVLLVSARSRNVLDAVDTMAAQTYPQVEIVVGLHGCELSRDARARLVACGRPTEVVDVPRSYSLGEALGAVTARARGELVAKVDDDDGYGPEHLWDLVVARAYSGAAMVGKAPEFVHLQPLDLTVRRSMASETYSTTVAGGALLLGRGDLAAVGGWRPVPRGVDRSLMDRLTRDGGLIYRTHPFGFVHCRHSHGHTWEPGLEYFLRGSGAQWRGRPPFAALGQHRG